MNIIQKIMQCLTIDGWFIICGLPYCLGIGSALLHNATHLDTYYPVQIIEPLLCNDINTLWIVVQKFVSGLCNDINELAIWVQKFVLLAEFGMANIVCNRII